MTGVGVSNSNQSMGRNGPKASTGPNEHGTRKSATLQTCEFLALFWSKNENQKIGIGIARKTATQFIPQARPADQTTKVG
jgi:hypothetical protein